MGADTPGTCDLGSLSSPLPWLAPPSHAGSPNLLKPPPTYSSSPGIVPMIAIWPATEPGWGILSFATLFQNCFTGSG